MSENWEKHFGNVLIMMDTDGDWIVVQRGEIPRDYLDGRHCEDNNFEGLPVEGKPGDMLMCKVMCWNQRVSWEYQEYESGFVIEEAVKVWSFDLLPAELVVNPA